MTNTNDQLNEAVARELGWHHLGDGYGVPPKRSNTAQLLPPWSASLDAAMRLCLDAREWWIQLHVCEHYLDSWVQHGGDLEVWAPDERVAARLLTEAWLAMKKKEGDGDGNS